jgi:ribose 5-phosphate isomerase B
MKDGTRDPREIEAAVREVLAEIEGDIPARGRVAVGSDHGGFDLKKQIVRYLVEELGYAVKDVGTHSTDSVDYPDTAAAVARAVQSGECFRGIVIDAAGIGSAIACNKFRGVRAAVCQDLAGVRNSREHNDANVLSLGSRFVNPGLARSLVRVWLSTEFAGGRHARRIQKISAIEESEGMRGPGAGTR